MGSIQLYDIDLLDSIQGAYYHGHGQAATDASFGIDAQRAALTLIVEDESVEEAIGQLLGYPNAGGQGIVRQLPAVHPRFGWMRASSISSIKQGGNPTVTGEGPMCDYAWLTVAFDAPPYNIAPDGGPEYQRFTTLKIQPVSQFLTRQGDGTQLLFTDPAMPPGYGKNTGVKGDRGLLVQRSKIEMRWLCVPPMYVTNKYGFPNAILPLVGQVNSLPFLGCPPGTLLMQDPQIQPVTAPVDPTFIGSPTSAPIMYHITICMEKLDPPVIGTVYGHLTAPIPAHAQGLWAEFMVQYTTQGGATMQAPPYQSGDLAQAFLPLPPGT